MYLPATSQIDWLSRKGSFYAVYSLINASLKKKYLSDRSIGRCTKIKTIKKIAAISATLHPLCFQHKYTITRLPISFGARNKRRFFSLFLIRSFRKTKSPERHWHSGCIVIRRVVYRQVKLAQCSIPTKSISIAMIIPNVTTVIING